MIQMNDKRRDVIDVTQFLCRRLGLPLLYTDLVLYVIQQG